MIRFSKTPRLHRYPRLFSSYSMNTNKPSHTYLYYDGNDPPIVMSQDNYEESIDMERGL